MPANNEIPFKILEKVKTKADQAEVYFSESSSHTVTFKADTLYAADLVHAKGAGLRVIHNGRIGFSATTDLKKLDRLVDSAVASSRFGQRAEFDFPSKTELPCPEIDDASVRNLDPDRCVKMGESLIENIRTNTENLQTDAEAEKIVSRNTIVNTAGLSADCSRTVFSFGAAAVRVDDTGLLWLEESYDSCRFADRTDEMCERIRERAEIARTLDAAPQNVPVIFAPSALPNLLEAFIIALNGKQVQKGASPLKDKLEQRVLSEDFVLEDNGILDWRPASAGFDGEGIPRRKNVLIEKGVIKSFLFDLQTAGLMEKETTGSALRSYTTQTSPGITNLIVPPGKTTLKEMIGGLKDGLIIYSCLGGGQSNLLAGDFSLNAHLGFRIRNGELTGRVKDCMVSGNVYEVFKKIDAVSSEAKEHGRFILPYMQLSGIRISG